MGRPRVEERAESQEARIRASVYLEPAASLTAVWTVEGGSGGPAWSVDSWVRWNLKLAPSRARHYLCGRDKLTSPLESSSICSIQNISCPCRARGR